MTRSLTTSGEPEKPQSGLFAPVSDCAFRDHTTAPVLASSAFTMPVAPNVVDASVDDGRRSARTGAGGRFPEPRRVAMSPHQLAGGQAVAGDDLVVAALLLRVDEGAADGEGRPAGADLPPPHLDRRRLRPVGLDPHAADDVVAIGSAKARPDGRLLRHRWSRRLLGSRRDGGTRRRGRRRRRRRRHGLVAGLGQKTLLGRRGPSPMNVKVEVAGHPTGANQGQDAAREEHRGGQGRQPDSAGEAAGRRRPGDQREAQERDGEQEDRSPRA